MTGASQGACFGRAPPSLRSPPAITAIDLPARTYRKIWTQLSPRTGHHRNVIGKHLPGLFSFFGISQVSRSVC